MGFFRRKKDNKIVIKKVLITDGKEEYKNDLINEFIETQKSIFDAFDLGKTYHIKNLTDKKWSLRDFDDGKILRYWLNDDRYEDCVIVKEQGESVIKEYEGYSIVVALDCVKTAFLFKTEKLV